MEIACAEERREGLESVQRTASLWLRRGRSFSGSSAHLPAAGVASARDILSARDVPAIHSSDRWLQSQAPHWPLVISSGHYSHGASGLCDKRPPQPSRGCASFNFTMAMRSPLSHAVKRATWKSPATPIWSPCTQRWKRGNATVAPPPVTQSSAGSKGPTAMVFMNMGGPSTTDEVHGFLSNLFVRHDFKVRPP
jgi:hypothetical protein